MDILTLGAILSFVLTLIILSALPILFAKIMNDRLKVQATKLETYTPAQMRNHLNKKRKNRNKRRKKRSWNS